MMLANGLAFLQRRKACGLAHGLEQLFLKGVVLPPGVGRLPKGALRGKGVGSKRALEMGPFNCIIHLFTVRLWHRAGKCIPSFPVLLQFSGNYQNS